jgi:hypothetical protein
MNRFRSICLAIAVQTMLMFAFMFGFDYVFMSECFVAFAVFVVILPPLYRYVCLPVMAFFMRFVLDVLIECVTVLDLFHSTLVGPENQRGTFGAWIPKGYVMHGAHRYNDSLAEWIGRRIASLTIRTWLKINGYPAVTSVLTEQVKELDAEEEVVPEPSAWPTSVPAVDYGTWVDPCSGRTLRDHRSIQLKVMKCRQVAALRSTTMMLSTHMVPTPIIFEQGLLNHLTSKFDLDDEPDEKIRRMLFECLRSVGGINIPADEQSELRRGTIAMFLHLRRARAVAGNATGLTTV